MILRRMTYTYISIHFVIHLFVARIDEVRLFFSYIPILIPLSINSLHLMCKKSECAARLPSEKVG